MKNHSHLLRFVITTIAALTILPAAADEPKAILYAALRDGSASGIVTGPTFAGWQAMSKSTSPLSLEATIIKRFSQPRCGRIKAIFTQQNVRKKDGTKGPFSFAMELNLCDDGTPPLETVDISNMNSGGRTLNPADIR